MAKHAKPGEAKAASQPEAESVDREPTGEPTPQEHGLPVDQEDAPKGQPTSDRFKTEQAHQDRQKNAKKR